MLLFYKQRKNSQLNYRIICCKIKIVEITKGDSIMGNASIKVLIGDNSVTNGIKAATILKENGMIVCTRKMEGNTIYESIIKEQPDVVITALTMQDTDAIILIKRVKEQLINVPAFIVISNIKNSFIERQVLDSGANYFLSEPIEFNELASIVKSVYRKPGFNSSADTEIMVTDIIQKMGVPAHIKGYHYLRTAIISTINNRELMESITKQLYPSVVIGHGTGRVLFFDEETVVPRRNRGRPKERRDGV